jgi:hypothetical protein
MNSMTIVCNFLGGNKEKSKLKYLRNIWHLARDFNLAPPKIPRFSKSMVGAEFEGCRPYT